MTRREVYNKPFAGFCSPRGPVIGPLVLAGVCLEESKLSQLKKLGVKDSKLLSPKRRQELAVEIKKLTKKIKIVKIDPAEIDSRASVGLNLNQLEALYCAKIIDDLEPDVVYVDSPTSPRASKFADMIKAYLKTKKKIKIIAQHRADIKFPIVSASSVLAKITRDAEIERIKIETGESFGSGYPSDPLCQAFMQKHWSNAMSKYIRKTWETFKRAKAQKEQKRLGEFE